MKIKWNFPLKIHLLRKMPSHNQVFKSNTVWFKKNSVSWLGRNVRFHFIESKPKYGPCACSLSCAASLSTDGRWMAKTQDMKLGLASLHFYITTRQNCTYWKPCNHYMASVAKTTIILAAIEQDKTSFLIAGSKGDGEREAQPWQRISEHVLRPKQDEELSRSSSKTTRVAWD